MLELLTAVLAVVTLLVLFGALGLLIAEIRADDKRDDI